MQPVVSFQANTLLDSLMADNAEKGPWRFSACQLGRAQLCGDENTCLLALEVQLSVQDWQGKTALQLALTLQSSPWAVDDSTPPILCYLALEHSQPVSLQSALNYQVTDLQVKPVNAGADSFWQRYLFADNHALAVPPATINQSQPLNGQLCVHLQQWLQQHLDVMTVEGAIACVCNGSVGAFGPLTSLVLARSQQRDLAVDARCLAKNNNESLVGHENATSLALYGERFGYWLLHRRIASATKPRRQDSKVVIAYRYELMIAETIEALIAQAGLGDLEKALFQQAGVLDDERLYEPATPATQKEVAPGLLDLRNLPPRQRRPLETLFSLVQTGALSPVDTDLLLRLARQIAKR